MEENVHKMRTILIIAVVFAVLALAFAQVPEDKGDEEALEERILGKAFKKLFKFGKHIPDSDDDDW
ncbi:hypothetical protein J437_LFUL001514 [Ladona fulva]|uniref:Uncharacterized protein n=1 Tax=Ladona fulva TaxID=123851 RepID=A0A8K0JWQ2_LADFU|nr:hypothetical protein J437_LFUL001514 [Ladona fulva]